VAGYRALLGWLAAPRAETAKSILGLLAERDAATVARLKSRRRGPR
jgi:hypothetical protein